MTIDEFAREIGVSTSTVSRTLSGSGRISANTRQMVFQRMEELGYTPNATAQRLASGKTQTVLFDCGEIPPFADMYMLGVMRGAQRALAKHGYGMLLNSPNSDPVTTVIRGAVDGAILVGDDTANAAMDGTVAMALQIANRGKICVVLSHAMVSDRRIGSVVLDAESGARELARALVKQGHRRTGFICSRTQDSVWNAFQDELAQIGGTSILMVVTGNMVEDGEDGMRRLLALHEGDRPTAVFARNDTLAAGALRAARHQGLRVPEDISLIGHDDVIFAQLLEPSLTTVRVDCERLGNVAAEMVLTMIEAAKPKEQMGETPPPCYVPTAVVWRDSVTTPP